MTSTGQGAWWTQFWVTEPSRAAANPPCPRLPTTRRSAPAGRLHEHVGRMALLDEGPHLDVG